MAAVVYFFVNIGASKYLGKLALFQMMKGEYDFMFPMALAALLLTGGGILLRERFGSV